MVFVIKRIMREQSLAFFKNEYRKLIFSRHHHENVINKLNTHKENPYIKPINVRSTDGKESHHVKEMKEKTEQKLLLGKKQPDTNMG